VRQGGSRPGDSWCRMKHQRSAFGASHAPQTASIVTVKRSIATRLLDRSWCSRVANPTTAGQLRRRTLPFLLVVVRGARCVRTTRANFAPGRVARALETRSSQESRFLIYGVPTYIAVRALTDKRKEHRSRLHKPPWTLHRYSRQVAYISPQK
jgi:hypothetical protein